MSRRKRDPLVTAQELFADGQTDGAAELIGRERQQALSSGDTVRAEWIDGLVNDLRTELEGERLATFDTLASGQKAEADVPSELSVRLTKAQELLERGKQKRALDELWSATNGARGNVDALKQTLDRATTMQGRLNAHWESELAVVVEALHGYIDTASRPAPARPAPAPAAGERTRLSGGKRVTAGFGTLLVALTPLSELFVWLGAGGIYSLRVLLEVMGVFAGIPLGAGVALIASVWAKRPQLRVRAGLLLVFWVAPIGTLLATKGNYSESEEALTIAVVGGVPFRG